MKKILILNGSPRKNGRTASIIKAFIEGAESAGNEVNELYITGMDIGSCLACESCTQNGGYCIQKDDMEQVNEAYIGADVVVFASPMFWGTLSGQLKICIDRLYAVLKRIDSNSPAMHKETALIMTARSPDYSIALKFYSIFTDIMRWKNWGTVLGAGKEDEAREIGASIK